MIRACEIRDPRANAKRPPSDAGRSQVGGGEVDHVEHIAVAVSLFSDLKFSYFFDQRHEPTPLDALASVVYTGSSRRDDDPGNIVGRVL